MHERQMTAIARRVERGGGLGDVLADDRDVADLLVALAELVVREADRARVVGHLGLFQRAAVERDRAGLVAARGGYAAVKAPEGRQPAGPNRLAAGVSRAAVRGTCLVDVVLHEPRSGE